MIDLDTLQFDANGLIPAIVQAPAGDVRMLGWCNREALEKTLATGLVTFFSRSRNRIWTKGEESGHTLKLRELRADCDRDALLVVADPTGPTCHRDTPTCFDDAEQPEGLMWLAELEQVLRGRKASASLEGSYTQKLFAQGVDRIAKKVVEEAGEVVLAAKNLAPGETGPAREAFLGEAADLLFHLELLLLDRGASLLDVVQVLAARHRERR
ncbi:MAG: bifunctional phosphoribosyl-AMP cyclohydrolase/phosphoribosyl-ATP diphosphatase HisIE [Deltaproteobacteria bacterium]|nr:bifunctional phosphoribosyl-AMP cyclohydrolase/phosphoribosyl-ATP diphosphatase HisIE [Deltaproteobacteria bacterium]